MSWYESAYRKLFLDYHTQRSAPEVGRSFDGARWAQTLQDAGVQAVSCISKCGYGWRYYRRGEVGRVHPLLPEGLDILEDTVRECHARDIRVIAYCHTFGSEYLAEERPDWLIRDAEGAAQGVQICLLTPALELELLPQLRELCANYDIDALFLDGTYYNGTVCHCEHCRARYLKETGRALPRPGDEAGMRAYSSWAQSVWKQIRLACFDAIRETRQDCLPCVNWGYSARQAEVPPQGVGFLSQDISPSDMSFSISYQARNWALSGVPFDVMNHMALKWWQEWSVKPLAGLMQESALLLMNGGRTWVGYQMYPQFGVSEYLLKQLKANFDFVKTLEPLLEGAATEPYVGVLHAETQTATRTVDPLSPFVDEHSLRSLHRMLTRSAVHYNSCTAETFFAQLSRFKAVIIANDQFVSGEQTAALAAYVEGGGNLLLTGKSGMVDARGAFTPNPALERVLGVTVRDGYPHGHGYIELTERGPLTEKVAEGPLLSTRPFMLAAPTSARVLGTSRAVYLRQDGNPLFTEFTGGNTTFSPPGRETGFAALTLNRRGAGAAVYCATDLFAGCGGNNNWSLKNLVRNILNELLLREAAIRVDAPDYVELSLMRRGSELQVHLCNLVRETPQSDFAGAIENIHLEDVLPIHGIGLKVPLDRAPKSVLLSGGSVDWTYEGGAVRLLVPKLDIHACVQIEEG